MQELDEDVEGMQSTILFLQQELKTSKDAIMNLENENLALKNGNAEAIKDTKCTNNNNTSTTTINVQNGNVTSSIITNCSVVLYSGNSDKFIANSERISRKDKLLNSVNVNNAAEQSRTLRSSTRNVSSEDLRTTMVNKNKLLHFNGGNNTPDDSNAMVITNGDSDSIVESLSPTIHNLESTTTKLKNCNNDKRNYNSDSTSDECDGDNDGGVDVKENKKRTKKVRRSSVLSLDLNEEDSQIEIDDERTINGKC